MDTNGFTLLEVTLFLAITGLVGLIAFVGLGPRFRNIRFTDAVRSLESNVQRNIVATESNNTRLSGVNCTAGSDTLKEVNISAGAGSDTAGGASNCVINGKVAIFGGSTVVYRPIVSLSKKNTDSTNNQCSNANLLPRIQHCYRARILDDTTLNTVTRQGLNVYTYANGLTKTSSGNTAVGFVKDPATNEALYFWYAPSDQGGRYLHSISPSPKSLVAESASVCFGMSNRMAQLTFDKSLTPKTEFDGGVC